MPSLLLDFVGEDPKLLADYKARGEPVPENHSPYFKFVPEPTIRTGVAVLTLTVQMAAGNQSDSKIEVQARATALRVSVYIGAICSTAIISLL